jgi:hypothetical protein
MIYGTMKLTAFTLYAEVFTNSIFSASFPITFTSWTPLACAMDPYFFFPDPAPTLHLIPDPGYLLNMHF